jgi:hypothetical protein
VVSNLEDLIDFQGYTFELKGRGIVYCGKLKLTITRKDILELSTIRFKENSYKILGVEAPCIPDPLREGISVGLLLTII